jgi:hypothetical protein
VHCWLFIFFGPPSFFLLFFFPFLLLFISVCNGMWMWMADGRYDGRDVVKKNRWNGHKKDWIGSRRKLVFSFAF